MGLVLHPTKIALITAAVVDLIKLIPRKTPSPFIIFIISFIA